MKRFSQVAALFSGLLFGLGMMMSGMVDPNKVIGFLDIAGHWDPSLAFVMGGALLVFMPMYFFVIRKQRAPVCAQTFQVSTNKKIDPQLVVGAVLFGMGWGIAGICPGPAITSVSGLNPSMLLFIAAMLLGMVAGDLIKNRAKEVTA